jgi:hypothetical protein
MKASSHVATVLLEIKVSWIKSRLVKCKVLKSEVEWRKVALEWEVIT